MDRRRSNLHVHGEVSAAAECCRTLDVEPIGAAGHAITTTYLVCKLCYRWLLSARMMACIASLIECNIALPLDKTQIFVSMIFLKTLSGN